MTTQNIGNSITIGFDDVVADFLIGLVLSEYKDKFAVKGAISLQELSKKKNYSNIIRTTTDLDMDLKTKSIDDWELFVQSIEKLATENSELRLTYKLVDRRGFRKNSVSDSLTFEVYRDNSMCTTFSIDVNLSSNAITFDKLDINNKTIDRYPAGYMIADKMKVIATEMIYRRTKDLIDLYILSQLENYTYEDLYNIVHEKLGNLQFNSIFFLDGCDKNKLLHAYSKLARVSNKPNLLDVITRVSNFTVPLYVHTRHIKNWDTKLGEWLE